MFEFFRLWLLVVSGAFAIAGIVLVVIVSTPLFNGFHRLFDHAFWPGPPDAATRSFQTWAYGVTFAVMAGWGLCMTIIVANGFASRQAWVWWTIAASVALWYPLDTGRSLIHRVYVNAIANTALLVILAIPLIGIFGEFH